MRGSHQQGLPLMHALGFIHKQQFWHCLGTTSWQCLPLPVIAVQLEAPGCSCHTLAVSLAAM